MRPFTTASVPSSTASSSVRGPSTSPARTAPGCDSSSAHSSSAGDAALGQHERGRLGQRCGAAREHVAQRGSAGAARGGGGSRRRARRGGPGRGCAGTGAASRRGPVAAQAERDADAGPGQPLGGVEPVPAAAPVGDQRRSGDAARDRGSPPRPGLSPAAPRTARLVRPGAGGQHHHVVVARPVRRWPSVSSSTVDAGGAQPGGGGAAVALPGLGVGRGEAGEPQLAAELGLALEQGDVHRLRRPPRARAAQPAGPPPITSTRAPRGRLRRGQGAARARCGR